MKVDKLNICLFKLILVASVGFAVGFTVSSEAKDNLRKNYSDSTLQEYVLDTIKFALGNQKSIQKLHSDTLRIEINGKYYKIPYRVVVASVNLQENSARYFTITGLSLREHLQFRKQIKDLFNNPRDKLDEQISAKDWRNSTIYDRYFRPYDKERESQNNNNQFEDVLGEEGKDENIVQDKIDFPVPETVDITVDLRNDQRTVELLGLKFRFDRLNPTFQSLLLNFKDNRNRSGNKTILEY